MHSIVKPLLFLFPLLVTVSINVQATIPPRQDGFWYENRPAEPDSVFIEAFFDPVCPDSRDAWPPLKQALHHYGSTVSLLLHPIPLPYHDNAFITSRALHVINEINSSATYSLLESLFEHQDQFCNSATFYISRASVFERIVKFTAKSAGNSFYSAIRSGFSSRKSDISTRVSYKYACIRGVYGAPYFFVNGFPLPDAGSAIDYKGWRSIIDPLVNELTLKEEYQKYEYFM